VPKQRKLVDRLMELCDNCLRCPANKHSSAPIGLEPYCKNCKLKWEAAQEIEYLRESILEENRRRD
jgi:hypothetical protein